jgi:EAL domain-containing protein (putative c-di-GMP-specific phosphodiesterase class I)
MRHGDWPRLAGLASFALLAVGCAAFLIASGDIAKSVTGVAILLLAVGQIIYMVGGWMRIARVNERQAMQGKALRDLAGTAKATADRLQDIELRLTDIEDMPRAPEVQTAPPPQPVPQPQPRAENSTIAEMQALRQQLRALADEITKPYGETPPPAFAETFVPPAEQPKPAQISERLDLLLEPVIEFATGETSHYRALLHMVGDDNDEIAHDDLMRRAAQNGARGKLDVHLLDQSLPVLRRLRQRNGGMRMFVPVGATTLTSAADLRQIRGLLEESRDVASGVVLEIIHSDLAKLDSTGIDGLAQLARLGVNMSLSRVSLSGLDLMSLRQLGVRFLDIDARTIDSGFGVAPAWSDFAQYARSMQFQLVAGKVETPAQSQAAARLARFGYGPAFAPPRRVRSGAGQSEPNVRFQAA